MSVARLDAEQLAKKWSTLPMRATSVVNIFSPQSSSSSEDFQTTGIRKAATMDNNRKIVHEIVNKIFDAKLGQTDVSSSHCSSIEKKSSEYSFDKRLKYWKDVLAERKKIECDIKRKIGKHPGAVLFNRSVTIDERDKQTVKRVLDYADRMNPIALMNKKTLKLQEYDDMKRCVHINELRETLPKSERDRFTRVEISGLPAITKKELLGTRKEQGEEKQSLWLKSKVLERRIEDKREDIERVIEYYPDIENLQIVGESLTKAILMKHNSEIELLKEEIIGNISSDTSLCEPDKGDRKQKELDEAPVDYAVKINDQVFKWLTKSSAKTVEIDVRFECAPFEKFSRRILHLQNVGMKILNFEWYRRSFYGKNSQMHRCTDDEFLFDHKPFRLIAGEMKDVGVQFEPRKVGITKEKWLLRIEPHFFCRKSDAVAIRLNGKCIAPPAYIAKLKDMQRIVIGKSKLKMVQKLTTTLGSITPLIQPPEVICPYKRTLNERELFEFYNIGYKCDRYHDIELLRDIHRRVKKPRDPAWDLKLDTLKTMIMQLESAEKCALIFNEFIGIVIEMRGTPVDLETRLSDNPEKNQARFIYVRGIICTRIDEWEELTVTVEEAALKPAFKNYYDELLQSEEEQEQHDEGSDVHTMHLYFMDEIAIRELLVKKIRRRKIFKDSLYIQTYTHVCNIVEDIVSIIESTEIF